MMRYATMLMLLYPILFQPRLNIELQCAATGWCGSALFPARWIPKCQPIITLERGLRSQVCTLGQSRRTIIWTMKSKDNIVLK